MSDFENDAPQESALSFWYQSAGLLTVATIALVTLAAIVLIIVLMVRGRGPALPAAIVSLMPLPLIVGTIALVAGAISYYDQLGNSPIGRVRWDGLGYGLSAIMQASGCFCPLMMLSIVLLMVIGYRGKASGL